MASTAGQVDARRRTRLTDNGSLSRGYPPSSSRRPASSGSGSRTTTNRSVDRVRTTFACNALSTEHAVVVDCPLLGLHQPWIASNNNDYIN